MPPKGPSWVPEWPKTPSNPRPVVPFSLVRRSSMIIADTGERIATADVYGTWKVANRASSDTMSECAPLLAEEPEGDLCVRRCVPLQAFPRPSTHMNVFKCVLTYTLASLFIFTPMNRIFGKVGSKHFVATVSIYFHPARTVGSMLEAVVFVAVMLAYGLGVALLSMVTAHLIYDIQWFQVGYIFMLLVFCGGALGSVGYFKLTMANRSFDTASSVAIIFLVVALIKEDDIQYGILSLSQLTRYFTMVACGVFISFIVCVTIKPTYAQAAVKEDLHNLMDSYCSMLVLMLNKFVRGQAGGSQLDSLQAKVTTLIKKTQTNLCHAKYELLVAGQLDEYMLLEKIVQSHTRIAMHIGGLAHCSEVLSQLLIPSSPYKDGGVPLYGKQFFNKKRISAGILLQTFVYHLGPPMNSFATTLIDIMEHLPFKGDGSPSLNHTHVNSIKSAISLYSSARESALETVYSHRVFGPKGSAAHTKTRQQKPSSSSKTDPESASDEEAVVATCGNFSYLLEDLGEEVGTLLKILDRYATCTAAHSRQYGRIFTQFWTRPAAQKPFSRATGALAPSRLEPQSWSNRLWAVTQRLKQPQYLFAFKLGLGAMILATPAFIDRTRPTFREWRGEWALIIYMIMMARNLGAMTTNIPYRFGGTIAGAAVAVLAWQVSDANPLVLLLIGTITATACFFLILTQPTPIGRFTLLSYNLVCLYGYSVTTVPDGPPTSIVDIAVRRTAAVSFGVLWAVIITLSIFPMSARKTLRVELSKQWIRMGMVWRANPIATLPRKGSRTIHGIYGEEELQDAMIGLSVLLSNAPNEFRLRGSFDPGPFQKLLVATQSILDAYHSISILISKSPTASSRELELIEATRPEVNELSSTLFLYFYTASSSIRMGIPVPEDLPIPFLAVERMLTKLQQHRDQLLQTSQEADTEDFVLFYSYVLVTLTVTERLIMINDVLRKLYGAFYQDLFTYV